MSKIIKTKFSKLISVIMVLCLLVGIVSCLCSCNSDSGLDYSYESFDMEQPNAEDDSNTETNEPEDPAATEIKNEIVNIESQYVDNDGYVDSDEVQPLIDEVMQYVESRSDDVLYYEEGSECVYIRYKSGYGYIFQPREKDVLAGGNDLRIVTCQPHYTELNQSKAPEKSAARLLKNKYVNVVYDSKDSTYDTEVTREVILGLKGASIIIWSGHGVYSESIHSALVIQFPFEKAKKMYRQDCSDEVLLETKDGQTVVTAAFFDKYFSEGDLDGAVIYLGACHSAEDEYLANVLISKGAKTVFGNNDKSTIGYDESMSESIFSSFANGFSAETALNLAKIRSVDNRKGSLADVVIVGDEDYTIKDMKTYQALSNEDVYSAAEAEDFVNKLFGYRVDISKFMSSPVSPGIYFLSLPGFAYDRAARNIGLDWLCIDSLEYGSTPSDKTYKDYLSDDEIAQVEELYKNKIYWQTYVYDLRVIQAFVDTVWEPGRYDVQSIDKTTDYYYTSKTGCVLFFNEGVGDGPFWMNKVTNVTPNGNGYKVEVSSIEVDVFGELGYDSASGNDISKYTGAVLSNDADYDEYAAQGFNVDAKYIVNLVSTSSGLRVDSISKV